jgi:hypothetical protein
MLPVRSALATTAGRRLDVCRLVVVAAALSMSLASQATAASSEDQDDCRVTVTNRHGVFTVTASFTAPQAPAVARNVLTDYASIPTYMPQVRRSVVLERTERRAVIEQEAVARFLLFSKRIHLVLEVQEEPAALRFRDIRGQSFVEYHGAWHIEPAAGGTLVRYELTAKPGFAVPDGLLQRLLRRDAVQMLTGLRRQIAQRSGASLLPQGQQRIDP